MSISSISHLHSEDPKAHKTYASLSPPADESSWTASNFIITLPAEKVQTRIRDILYRLSSLPKSEEVAGYNPSLQRGFYCKPKGKKKTLGKKVLETAEMKEALACGMSYSNLLDLNLKIGKELLYEAKNVRKKLIQDVLRIHNIVDNCETILKDMNRKIYHLRCQPLWQHCLSSVEGRKIENSSKNHEGLQKWITIKKDESFEKYIQRMLKTQEQYEFCVESFQKIDELNRKFYESINILIHELPGESEAENLQKKLNERCQKWVRITENFLQTCQAQLSYFEGMYIRHVLSTSRIRLATLKKECGQKTGIHTKHFFERLKKIVDILLVVQFSPNFAPSQQAGNEMKELKSIEQQAINLFNSFWVNEYWENFFSIFFEAGQTKFVNKQVEKFFLLDELEKKRYIDEEFFDAKANASLLGQEVKDIEKKLKAMEEKINFEHISKNLSISQMIANDPFVFSRTKVSCIPFPFHILTFLHEWYSKACKAQVFRMQKVREVLSEIYYVPVDPARTFRFDKRLSPLPQNNSLPEKPEWMLRPGCSIPTLLQDTDPQGWLLERDKSLEIISDALS